MPEIKLAALAIVSSVLLGAAAPAPMDDPEATVVEELVVQAAEKGPAWWRVSDGDTVVYILGLPPARKPADAVWDSRLLERRLAGAHTVILPSSASVRVREAPAVLKVRRQLRSNGPLEQTLPPPLRARFVRAREAIKQPAKRYSNWNPIVAGEMLVNDTTKARGLTSTRVAGFVDARARQKPAPAKVARVYPGLPMMQRAIGDLTEATSLACLETALQSVEAPVAAYREAFEGWANGDIAAALKAPQGFEVCVRQVSGGGTFWRRTTDDAVTDIVSALAKPGHAVALVGLRQTVAEGGIVQTLEARGFRVQGPGDLD